MRSKFYRSQDRHYTLAQQAWVALVLNASKLSGRQPHIAFSVLAWKCGWTGDAGRAAFDRAVRLVGRYCSHNGLPPMDAIVSDKAGERQCGYSFSLDAKDLKQTRLQVLNFNWLTVRVPTAGTFRRFEYEGEL